MNDTQRTGNRTILHLCDFDGTLTWGDSLLRFLFFAVPISRLLVGGLDLMVKFFTLILAMKWSKSAGKAAVFSTFFKGKTAREMRTLGADFCQKEIPAMLRVALLEQLRYAHQNGETVVVVSASPDVWLRPFCAEEGFELLCTELEYVEDKFTGQFSTPNCNGAEKAARIQAAYDLDAFEKIVAYGNSNADGSMYDLATKVFKF